jgi:hypothetical protein
VLWTHNDSGNDPIVYAINLAGDSLAAFRVAGANLRDWEDIATAPCPGDRKEWCLYIGDIGDNSERRRDVTVYVVAEPDPRASGASGATAAARRVTLRYPDGPHDAEGLAIDPDGNGMIVTKGRRGPILRYRIDRTHFLRDSVTLEPPDTLDVVPQFAIGRVVTGAAISPGGTRAALRTYTEVYLYRYGPRGVLIPDGAPCWLGAADPQGEGIGFLDDDTLILTSESVPQRRGTVNRVRCPRSDRGGR